VQCLAATTAVAFPGALDAFSVVESSVATAGSVLVRRTTTRGLLALADGEIALQGEFVAQRRGRR
jgi:hypothetical protein